MDSKILSISEANLALSKSKVAFTLAEVLITLAIIGVVAAMTLPTLIQKHQKQQWVTGLRTSISILSNGLKKMMADEEVTNFYDTDFAKYCILPTRNVNKCHSIAQKYFKIVDFNRECTSKFCMDTFLSSVDEYYALQNGMFIDFVQYPFPLVFVDVNGKSKPNKIGKIHLFF